jgi:hypothetical protein
VLDSEIEERRERALTRLQQLVNGIVAEAAARHYDAPTQEHQFTSKVAALIEAKLGRLKIDGLEVTVLAQDFPDKGPNSGEKKSGSDLYISLVATSEADETWLINKGMLVQSKWDDTASGKTLTDQVRKMRRRSVASYVWVYTRSSISVVPASDVAGGVLDMTRSTTVGELIANGFRCFEGDPAIGRDLNLGEPESVFATMQKLSADQSLAISIQERPIV